MGRKAINKGEQAMSNNEELVVEAEEFTEEDIERIGPSYGNLWITMSTKDQAEYVENYIDKLWPCNRGESVYERNKRIRISGELNPYELYALCLGTFMSKSPKYWMQLIGADGDGDRRRGNRNASPVFFKFERHRPRPVSPEDNSWYSIGELENRGKFTQVIKDYASNADVVIPIEEYKAIFTSDKNLDNIKHLAGKKFCDSYRSASLTQQETLEKIAFYKVKQLVLNSKMYQRYEADRGFWLESRFERSLVEGEMEFEEAKNKLLRMKEIAENY